MRERRQQTNALTDTGVFKVNFFNCECVLRDCGASFRRFGNLQEDRSGVTKGVICIVAWVGWDFTMGMASGDFYIACMGLGSEVRSD